MWVFFHVITVNIVSAAHLKVRLIVYRRPAVEGVFKSVFVALIETR